MDLLSLPEVMLENIISYLPYDEIAKHRLVSRMFNQICMRLLNRGFVLIEKKHAQALKTVKAQLPRRESERRYHPMARHCDILSSIETRISMLNMTYSKFIDSGMCCFIPGKVIDEIKRVLTLVDSTKTTPRAHEVLQELRDISSMAIEHFDDKISPAFRKKLQEQVAAGTSHVMPRVDVALGPLSLKKELLQIRRRSMMNAKFSLYLAAQYKKFYKRMLTYKRVSMRQRKTIKDLTKRQNEQEASIADLKKRIEECDIKYSEITHTNQAVGAKTITAGTSAGPSTSQPLRHFASQIKLDLSVLPIGTSKRNQAKLPNIKPRKTSIKLPNLNSQSEPAVDQQLTSEKLSTNQTQGATELQKKLQTFENQIRKSDVRGSKRSLSLSLDAESEFLSKMPKK